MSLGDRAATVSLREALATVHRDRQWWLHCLAYGFAAATGIGLPIAAGFVMESLDNSRRGYPTPLPPWGDPVTRYLTGFFALLIDFTFFIMPLLLSGMLVICASITLIIAALGVTQDVVAIIGWIVAVAGLVIFVMFFLGVAPAGRLRFARDGRIDEALSAATWRWALSRDARGPFLRARFASLPAYLPVIALGAATVALARLTFPAQSAAIAAGLWLTMAALVYTHLVVVQLYVAAEKDAQRAALGM